MEDVWIDVPDGRINVWYRPADQGRDTTVLIHGLTGNSRWWHRVIELLPDDIGLIALDVRGRGGSVDAPPPYDLATIADDVARTLDHLAIERATIVGYSMGAWIAAVFDARHRDRVERLVLVDGGLPLPAKTSDPDEVIQSIVGPALSRLGSTFGSREDFFDYWRQHPALVRHWDDAMRPALDFELIERDGALEVRVNPDAVRESAREITVDPATNQAGARVGSPTHLIVVGRGTADQEGGMTPLHTAEETVAALDHMSMEYLAEVNHYTLVLGEGAPVVAAAIVG